MPGVVSVFPNVKRKLHTTHSWDFMGLSSEETMEIPGFSTKNQVNVIIGFIDTGNLSSHKFSFFHFTYFRVGRLESTLNIKLFEKCTHEAAYLSLFHSVLLPTLLNINYIHMPSLGLEVCNFMIFFVFINVVHLKTLLMFEMGCRISTNFLKVTCYI